MIKRYWGVLFFYLFLSSGFILGQTVPTNIPNLKLWLSADSNVVLDGTKVKEWHDISGNLNHAVQISGINQPNYINNEIKLFNKPAIQFDGIDDFMSGTIISNIANSSISIFVLASGGAMNPGERGIFSINDWTNGFWFERGTSRQTLAIFNKGQDHRGLFDLPNSGFDYKILTGIKKFGINVSTFINSNSNINPSTNSLLTGGFTNSNYILGKTFSTWLGNIVEVILYDRALTDNERQEVESYLFEKYSNPVSLGNDTTFKDLCIGMTLDIGNSYASQLWSTGENTSSISINNAGKYWVRTVDVFGYVSSDTIYVKPNIPFFQPPTNSILCSGSQIEWNTNYPKDLYTFQWQDGSSDSTFTITQPGIYYVGIRDTNACYLHSDTVNVTLDDFPVIATLGSDTILCTGNTISLTHGDEPGVNYQWSTGAGTNETIVTTTGNYWLKATNSNGCIKEDTIHVTINGTAPNTNFAVQNVCRNESATFVNQTSMALPATIQSYNWSFGDGNTSSLVSPQHLFNLAGTYQITLNAIASNGCSKSLKQQVTIYPTPSVNFTTGLSCSRKSTQFFDSSFVLNNPAVDWKWDFGVVGMEDTAIIKNPVFSYSLKGNYLVTLIASSALGCKDTLKRTITVNDSPAINYQFNNVCLGNAVQFNNFTSVGSPSVMSKYLWKFGDGDSTSTANPIHLYETAGVYTIFLRGESSTGCADTLTKILKIHQFPVADFSNSLPCLNQPVLFTDLSTIENDSILSWFWFFDNVKNASIPNPTYTFKDTGSHEIKLIVTSSGGCTDVKTAIIKQNPSPNVAFDFSPLVGVLNRPVNFLNSSSGALNYAWDLGNGIQSSLIQPVITYADTGIFTVNLIATNQYGCQSGLSRVLTVLKPLLDVSATRLSVAIDGNYLVISAEFTNNGSIEVYDLNLYLRTTKSAPVRENFIGVLSSGARNNYSFKAQLYMPEISEDEYICFRVGEPNGMIDENSANDEICINLFESGTVLMDPFPNPVDKNLNIKYITSSSGLVTIDIFDTSGNKIMNVHSKNETAGSNHLIVDLSSFSDGIYAVVLVFEDKQIVKKFLKKSK